MSHAAYPLEIDIAIEAGDWTEAHEAAAEDILRKALDESGVAVTGPSELSVLLTDDAHQRRLNNEWRQIDSPTNVLSFPQIAPFAPLSGLIGDISLSYETLQREADEQAKSFDDHFTHLLVHGLLHIIGYDHLTEDEAADMEGLETRILAGLGIADPYADDE